MRLPRHDTLLRLSAEPPREAIADDEALLENPGSQRWWTAGSPAVVVGLALHHRLGSVVDLDRCRAAHVDVVERRAGGGALLVDRRMLCGAISLPTAVVSPDVTESYRWLGDSLVGAFRSLGIDARRVDVDEARADVARLRAASDELSRTLLTTCYGALSPHEVVAGGRKLVGLAQVRRRHIVLYQFGVLLRDQSRLADYLRVPDDETRSRLRDALQARTVGLAELTDRPIDAVAAAIADATPSAP